MNPKDLRNINQAYSSIYEEQIEAGQHPGKSPDKRTRDKFETQSRRGTAPKGVGVPDKSVGYGQLKQDVDMFELVKGHLMSEGYADNEKAALAIMANMSEQWRDSIVEFSLPKSVTIVPPSGPEGNRRLYKDGGGDAAMKQKGQTRDQVIKQGTKNYYQDAKNAVKNPQSYKALEFRARHGSSRGPKGE